MVAVKNKWALITGAASGIGLETAIVLAKRGANIVATDVNLEALTQVKEKLDSYGVKVEIFEHNVAVKDDWARVESELTQQGIEIDVLINNAGIGWFGSINDHTENHWKNIFDVNVMGVVYGVQTFLPGFIASNKDKHIVNVSSLAALAPAANMSAYAASKGAVLAFTDSIGVECFGTKVQVSSVHPGFVNTPIVKVKDIPKNLENTLDKIHDFYSKCMMPSQAAEDIVEGIVKNRARIYTGDSGTSTGWAKRLLPTRWLWKLAHVMSLKAGYKPS